jgi:hypothetical protein
MTDTFTLKYENGESVLCLEDKLEDLDQIVFMLERFLKGCGFQFKDLIIQR